MTFQQHSGRATVLVADDDEVILRIVSKFLKNRDYDVITAADGRQAVELCEQWLPDIVLMDANMPDMDGFDACRIIRGNPVTCNLPIIMVTAMDDSTSVQMGFDAGAEEYITKPVNFSVLGRRIKLILEKQKAEYDANWTYQSQMLISALLQAEDPFIPLDRQLQENFELIMASEWLPLTGRGAMFLVDDKSQKLILTAQKNLDEQLLAEYASKPVEQCLCGQAVSSCQAIAAEDTDTSHEIYFEGTAEYGHYRLPIESGERLLGILNLYVSAGIIADSKLQSTLLTICKTLANIIVRKNMEAEIKEHRDQLTYEREIIEEIITRMRTTTRFDNRNLRYLQTSVETTAGDILLSAFRPDGGQHLMLGDFTGHGLPAALNGPTVSDIFYAMTGKGLPLMGNSRGDKQTSPGEDPVQHVSGCGLRGADPGQEAFAGLELHLAGYFNLS